MLAPHCKSPRNSASQESYKVWPGGALAVEMGEEGASTTVGQWEREEVLPPSLFHLAEGDASSPFSSSQGPLEAVLRPAVSRGQGHRRPRAGGRRQVWHLGRPAAEWRQEGRQGHVHTPTSCSPADKQEGQGSHEGPPWPQAGLPEPALAS